MGSIDPAKNIPHIPAVTLLWSSCCPAAGPELAKLKTYGLQMLQLCLWSQHKALNLRMTKRFSAEEVCLFAVRKRQDFSQPWTAVLIKQADLGDISSVY